MFTQSLIRPLDGFIQDQVDDDEDINTGDDQFHREVDRRREAIVEEDAEKLASEYREKYGRSTASKYRGDTGNVPQRLLLPSVQDPNIWGVRCKPGKERELVRLIMKKKTFLQNSNAPLEIFSAFQRDGYMGYIYIEARKVTAVDQAIKGFANVYGMNKVLVPIKEYTDLLRVNKSKEQELTPGTYVRIRRGKYQGDLAIVENLSENGLEAQLKIVPRLDYGRAAALNKNADGKRRAPNSAKNRPAPRLFSESDAVNHDQRHLTKRGPKSFIYHNDIYENGFLFKDYRLTFLDTENIKPTLDELQRFNSASDEGIDLTALAQTLKNDRSKSSFQVGDDVEVFTGEQTGVEGSVIGVHGEIVTLQVTSGPLKGQKFDAPSSNLRKRFAIGEHVRVSSGNYSGEVGMVVGIDKDSVTIVSDSSRNEVTVFSRDLQGAADVADIDEDAEFALLDLVQVNSQTVACIIKIERDSLTLLTQDAQVRVVPPSSIIMKLKNRRSFATDRDGQEIQVGDTVKELYGEGKTGVILHIHRTYLFLQDRSRLENLGVFVASINSVTTVAVKGARVDSGKNSKTNDYNSNDQRAMNRGNNRKDPSSTVPIRQGGRDRIIGRLVTIGKGSQYKGLKGTVRDTTDTMARVELESKAKTVTVSKGSLLFKDNSGNMVTYTEFIVPKNLMHLVNPSQRRGGQQSNWGNGGRTPASNYGGRTPGWAGGSRTPGWSDGGRTPAGNRSTWGGSKTPAYGGGDGFKTPAYGNTGRNSTWGEGSRTPAYGSRNSGYNRGGWGDGSRTPGAGNMSTWDPNSSASNNYGNERSRSWYDSSRSSDMSAPTPGGFSAPTPAAMGTPGAFSAPTPGVFHNEGYDTAPTPGAYDAKTPGAAPTPAAWSSAADIETPRYEPGTP